MILHSQDGASPVMDFPEYELAGIETIARGVSIPALNREKVWNFVPTAKEGDDIVSIAIAYGISPSRLMDLNDLKAGDSIKAGQVLKLPADAKPSAQ